MEADDDRDSTTRGCPPAHRSPVWARALESRGLDSGGWAVPAWSARDAVAMMDRHSIATGVLSVTAPGVHLGTTPGARPRPRRQRVRGRGREGPPGRIGSFASLPLPDVDGALEEAAYALDTLGADGVVLVSNVRGRYLGDPEYARCGPNSTGAPPWCSSTRPAADAAAGRNPAPLADFVFDTTRTALNMVLGGVMSRYPNVKVILSHGGGFLPYAAYRFSGVTPPSTPPSTRRTCCGTSSASTSTPRCPPVPAPCPPCWPSPSPAMCSTAATGPSPRGDGHVLRPLPGDVPGLRPGQAEAIDRGSAEALFPRLAD
ncbi:amidohydrolase family protein [Streptomyces sp. M19]